MALTRSGGNVLERSIEELDEIVDFLEDNGVRRDWVGYVVSRCPEVLSFTMDELRSRAEFYLKMGMDKNDFGTMLFDCPKVLGYLSLEEMNRKVLTVFFFNHPSFLILKRMFNNILIVAQRG